MDFDITQAGGPLNVRCWGRAAIIPPITEQNVSYIDNLIDIEHSFGIKAKLNPASVNHCKWDSPLLEEIYKWSYPLRSLLKTPGMTPEWLLYWEIYSYTVMKTTVDYIRKRRDVSNTPLREIVFRSFHIGDAQGLSAQVLQRVVNYIEFNNSIHVEWKWLVTGPEPPSTDTHWVGPVDSDDVSVANMRAWHNRIGGELHNTDFIIGCSKNQSDKPAEMSFMLLNLAIGGTAVVIVSKMADTAIASMTHIFARSFESTHIRHSIALDTLVIYGINFLGGIGVKAQRHLYEFCDSYRDINNTSPFTAEYLHSESFNETIKGIMTVNSYIFQWREDYYYKLLTLYKKLHKSKSARLFDDFVTKTLEDAYKDQSKKWVSKTSFQPD